MNPNLALHRTSATGRASSVPVANRSAAGAAELGSFSQYTRKGGPIPSGLDGHTQALFK